MHQIRVDLVRWLGMKTDTYGLTHTFQLLHKNEPLKLFFVIHNFGINLHDLKQVKSSDTLAPTRSQSLLTLEHLRGVCQTPH